MNLLNDTLSGRCKTFKGVSKKTFCGKHKKT